MGTHAAHPARALPATAPMPTRPARIHGMFGQLMRHPSRIVRLTRALVGLVTVWCLGCSSYESIVASLLGAPSGSMMACGDESPVAPQIGAAPSEQSATRAVATIAATNESRSFDCGCGGSCHAPSPQAAAVSSQTAPIPVALQFAPTAPTSLTRAPLLPPPEFAV